MKSLLIFVLSLVNFSAQISPECEEVYSTYIHPSNCCNYPLIVPHEYEVVMDCDSDCEYGDKCCRQDCLYNKLGIFDEEKLNKENLLKLLMATIKDEKAKDEWKGEIEKNIETCENFSK